MGGPGCRENRQRGGGGKLPIWVALNRQRETTHLIEWLIAAWDKPWSGKVHATIVGLDEATQAEWGNSGKLPTLEQMIRDARGDQQVIRRAMQPALSASAPANPSGSISHGASIGCVDLNSPTAPDQIVTARLAQQLSGIVQLEIGQSE